MFNNNIISKQGIALIIGLAAAEVNSLILNPLVTNLMFDRNNIEFLQAAKVYI